MSLNKVFEIAERAGMDEAYLLAHKLLLEQELEKYEYFEKTYGSKPKSTIRSLLVVLDSRLNSLKGTQG